jgi:hypothetical protein
MTRGCAPTFQTIRRVTPADRAVQAFPLGAASRNRNPLVADEGDGALRPTMPEPTRAVRSLPVGEASDASAPFWLADRQQVYHTEDTMRSNDPIPPPTEVGSPLGVL